MMQKVYLIEKQLIICQLVKEFTIKVNFQRNGNNGKQLKEVD
jgi:hypothetical protein